MRLSAYLFAVLILFAYNEVEVIPVLNDSERKLLRILTNRDISKRTISTYNELFWMTGRNEKMIIRSLNLLKEAGFIDWDGKYTQSIEIKQVEVNPPPSSYSVPYGYLQPTSIVN
jgi:predicted transcriptional regulator